MDASSVNWDAIGAAGEVLGALAVVLTLVYVAREVKHGTNAILSANHEAMISALRTMRHAISGDEQLASLVVRAEAGDEALSEVEERRFEEYAMAQLEIWEQAHVNFGQGTIDETGWDGWDGFGRAKLTTAGHQRVWKRRRMEFYESFREYIEREVFRES